MPVQINEVVVSVQVGGDGANAAGNPPNNADLSKMVKKAVDEIKAVVKSKNER